MTLIQRYLKYLLHLLPDMLAIPFSWFLSWYLSGLSLFSNIVFDNDFIVSLGLITLLQGLSYWYFSLYRSVWRYASVQDCIRIIKSTATTTFGVTVLFVVIQMNSFSITSLVFYFFILSGVLCASRLIVRYFLDFKRQPENQKRVLIVGAGQGAELLLRDLIRDPAHLYCPVALVDDSLAKQGKEIHGVRVLGRIGDIANLVIKLNIEQIFIAIPSASSSLMRKIIALCHDTGIAVQTLPGLNQLAKQEVSLNLLRKVSIDDLLGREPVSLDWGNIYPAISGKIVLVSGAGGSIGSELCCQIAKLKADKLIVVEHSEYNLYTLQQQLQVEFPELVVKYQLCSVTNKQQIERIFARYQPHVVFHAAAYKHVPILEDQVQAAVLNNVVGTKVMVDVSIGAQVEKFVLISTDKAVNPTNIMGATKRIAEMYCQKQDALCQTKFITVRFGNVLGSAGSVIPLFKKQIESGGPVTITHPDIKRYFMTIPEACQLIMQAFSMGNGGEIFVLEMGELVRIKELAEQLIILSGYQVNKDIKLVYTGLRPGEKMIEELFYNEELLEKTDNKKILRANSKRNLNVNLQIEALCQACECGIIEDIKILLKRAVPEFYSHTDNALKNAI